MEMKQLLKMGFSTDEVAGALAATAGNSTIEEAIDYILTHPSSSISPKPSQHQPKLDRFFPSKSSKSPIMKKQEPSEMKSLPPLKRKRPTMTPNEQRNLPTITPNEQRNLPTMTPNEQRNLPTMAPNEPLYERMRPRAIDDIVGQDDLLTLLRSALDCNGLPSVILWGPPGTGKTSIAKAIVNSFSSDCVVYQFFSLSAINSGVEDIRVVVDKARKLKQSANKKTVLFVDEVHLFNKSQLESFLPAIKDGSVVLMGATTENPSFSVSKSLLSRCSVWTLKSLKPHHVATLLRRAVMCPVNGLLKSVGNGVDVINVNDDVIEYLSHHCDGDARVALIALEISALTAAARLTRNEHGRYGNENGVGSILVHVAIDDAKETMQSKHIAYDKKGEQHYNLISALHKSIRGNDADAAIYWLARMLEGGEEPLYIARRLIRIASEDVGYADASAMTQAVACYQACRFIGMPECDVNLAQCVIYLAVAPKSIVVYRALGDAQKVVRKSVGQNEGVPMHLRNAPTKLMADPSVKQLFLPPSLEGSKFLKWPQNLVSDG